jgi:hypothetical protein
MHMKNLALIAAILMLAPGAFAQVTDFTVENYSFETLPSGENPLPFGPSYCGTGCSYDYGSTTVPGWAASGSYGVAGQEIPGVQDSNFSSFNSVPDGITIAYVIGPGTLTQTVTGATVVPGEIYTLQVAVGCNKSSSSCTAGGDYVDLLIGSTPMAATGTTPTAGNWTTWTATYTGLPGDSGDTIVILLGATGTQGDFDDVTLTGTTVPEGGATALYLLLGGSCCFWAIFLGSRKQFGSRA